MLIKNYWETSKLVIKDSIIDESDKLMILYSKANKYMRVVNGTGGKSPIKCIEEGNLPNGGNKEFYKIQSIYLKESIDIIGYIEIYHGYPKKDVLYVGFLYINPEFQHKGFGQEVVKNFINEAYDAGYSRVYINIDLKNWPSLRFWTKLGFDKIIGIYGDKEYTENTYASVELEKCLIE